MTNKEIADKYLIWFSKKYDYLKNKYRRFCSEKHYDWDDDIFSDTYVKIYDAIERNGLSDYSDAGFDNYTFKSFKQNLQREKQYCRVAKRDYNVTTDEVNQLYEDKYNRDNDSSLIKLKNDLYIDFATLYIMQRVEQEFDGEHFLLFRLKTLCNLTYRQLQDKTRLRGVRQKFLTVKNWVKTNVTRQEVNDAFYQMYGDLL